MSNPPTKFKRVSLNMIHVLFFFLNITEYLSRILLQFQDVFHDNKNFTKTVCKCSLKTVEVTKSVVIDQKVPVKGENVQKMLTDGRITRA